MMHILQAFRERKSDQALFETCTYLAKGDTDSLEDEWIAILSEIGMSRETPKVKELWSQCMYDVKALIDADAIDVTDALVCTTKLYLLYVRTAAPISNSLAQLRIRVIKHFPAGARLAYKGVLLFDTIIPEETDKELHDFAHRILSGFIKLFHTHDPMTANAVEFIARKKMCIPCKRVWPTPDPQEAAKGDPVWFVWGAILLYFPNDLYVHVAWTLFGHKIKEKSKKQPKMERLGLLVGAAACAAYDKPVDSVDTDMIEDASANWTTNEANVIDNIYQLAPDLWASHSPPQDPKQRASLGEGKSTTKTGLGDDTQGKLSSVDMPDDVLMDFVPLKRNNHQPAVGMSSFSGWGDGEDVKIISLGGNSTGDKNKRSRPGKMPVSSVPDAV